jgi:streptomycin 6-kinase
MNQPSRDDWLARIPDLVERYVRQCGGKDISSRPSRGPQVLVHQDLHGRNVLAAQREPWLAIDPKPLAGEREFACAPIVRSSELGETKRDALYRLDRLSSELNLDRERIRGWTIGQTIAWSGGRDYHAKDVELIRWLLTESSAPRRCRPAPSRRP